MGITFATHSYFHVSHPVSNHHTSLFSNTSSFLLSHSFNGSFPDPYVTVVITTPYTAFFAFTYIALSLHSFLQTTHILPSFCIIYFTPPSLLSNLQNTLPLQFFHSSPFHSLSAHQPRKDIVLLLLTFTRIWAVFPSVSQLIPFLFINLVSILFANMFRQSRWHHAPLSQATLYFEYSSTSLFTLMRTQYKGTFTLLHFVLSQHFPKLLPVHSIAHLPPSTTSPTKKSI